MCLSHGAAQTLPLGSLALFVHLVCKHHHTSYSELAATPYPYGGTGVGLVVLGGFEPSGVVHEAKEEAVGLPEAQSPAGFPPDDLL